MGDCDGDDCLDSLFLETLHSKVINSNTYSIVDRFVKNKIPFIRNTEAVTMVSQNPEKLAKLQSTPEFQAVYRDDTFREVLSDKKTMAQIKGKDVVGLIQNPKFLAMWENEEFKKKVAKLFVAIEKLEPLQAAP